MSETQFEHLVGMLADNRTGIINAKNELMNELEKTKRELRQEIRAAVQGQQLLAAHLTAIEEDVGKVQGAVRGHTETSDKEFRQIHQSLEGLTQLGKSSWDTIESLQKHIHGEVSLQHASGQESHRAQ